MKKISLLICSMAVFAAIFSGCSKTGNGSGGSGSSSLSVNLTSPVSLSTIQTSTGVTLAATTTGNYPIKATMTVTNGSTPTYMFSHIPSTVHAWAPGTLSYTIPNSSNPNLSANIPLDTTIAAGTYVLNSSFVDASNNSQPFTTIFTIQNSNDIVLPVLKDTTAGTTWTVATSGGSFTVNVTLTDNRRLGSLEINMISQSTKVSTSVVGTASGINPLDLTQFHGTGIIWKDQISPSAYNLQPGTYTLQIIGRDAVNNFVEHEYTVILN